MKKIWEVVKDIVFFIALIIVSVWIVGITDVDYSDVALYALGLAFIMFYIWKKIDSKFFKK